MRSLLMLGYIDIVEWVRIPRNTRSRLGSMFFNYAQTQGSIVLTILGKSAQNQQLYRKN